MFNELPQTLLQYASVAFLSLVALIVLMIVLNATDLGRTMLPNSVAEVLSKLLPHSLIEGVRVTGAGQFELRVQGAERLKTVHVLQTGSGTIAWTYDEERRCPQSGTFAFTDFRHNLRTDTESPINPDLMRSRIAHALNRVLDVKGFSPASHDEADIRVSVFAAIEREVSIGDLHETLAGSDITEWKAAIRTAVQHDGAQNPATLAAGSLLINVLDTESGESLWRAATFGKFVVDVSEGERERRITLAVSEMLGSFPPKSPAH